MSENNNEIFPKKNILTTPSNQRNTKYQYSYVELEEVVKNPSEYIIPECLPACQSLWNKNIETFMVSNNDDANLYVLLSNVSEENMKIFYEHQKIDSRFFISTYRKAIGIKVHGNDEKAMSELTELTEAFKIQDTLRFKKAEGFLEQYKCTGGGYYVDDCGYICQKTNPNLKNVTLQEALEKTGKSNLYISTEGRIYESSMYLSWHKRYLESLQNNLDNTISHNTFHK